VATVVELSAPYENHLLPILGATSGVCAVCHTFVTGGWDRCYQCNEAARDLRATADAAGFVGLAVKGEQLARDLWVYKSSAPEAARRPTRFGLAAVLWRWLETHESCVADDANVDDFSVVSTVPSTTGRSNHPLNDIVGSLIDPTARRYRTLLRPSPWTGGDRDFSEDRFEVVEPTDGEPVLLIDDTYTTGSRVQSAVAALKEGGAGPVGVVCLGRHFNRHPQGDMYREAAEEYYRKAKRLGWSWDECCLCGNR